MDNQLDNSNGYPKKNGHSNGNSKEPQRKHPTILKQVYGLLLKKTVYTLRKRKILAGQFLMPPIMIIVAILLFNTFYVPRESYPLREIKLSQYKDPIVVYQTEDEVINITFNDFGGKQSWETISRKLKHYFFSQIRTLRSSLKT